MTKVGRFKAKQKKEGVYAEPREVEPATEHRASCRKVITWNQRPRSKRSYGLSLRDEAPARESSRRPRDQGRGWSFRKRNQKGEGESWERWLLRESRSDADRLRWVEMCVDCDRTAHRRDADRRR